MFARHHNHRRRLAFGMFVRAAALGAALLCLWEQTAGASLPVLAGYRDQSYPNNTGGDSRPTAEKPESKLWFNDGLWWGSLWSVPQASYRIFKLDTATESWIDAGTSLDERAGSKADTLWDGQKLYVVSHLWVDVGVAAPPGSRGRLYRFSYASATKTYTLDSGFPVEVTGGQSETLVLAKDTTGTLWVTYVENQQVMLNHSVGGDDQQWGTPFALPASTAANLTTDDISSIVAYDTHIGVMWSNETNNQMYFARHTDGAADNAWTSVVAYGVSADDHISLKSVQNDSAGKIFAAIKTSSGANLIVLLVCANTATRCTAASDWQSFRVYDSVTFNPTRPIVSLDTNHRRIYVFTSNVDPADNTAGIYFKRTSMDAPSFTTNSIGAPFMHSAGDVLVSDPSSMKQNLTDASGLTVVGDDRGAKVYLHNRISLTAPAVLAFDPASGAVGTSVTLAGNNFTGATSVTFNGTPATFSVVSDQQILATVPTGATTGHIAVGGPNGTGLSTTDFSVTTAGGNITFKDVRTGTSVSSSTVSTSTNVTSAAGDLYLAAVAAKSNTTVTGVTGMGLTWTPVVVQCAGRAQTGVAVWKAQGTPSGDGLVAATLGSTPSSAVIAVSRYSAVSSGTPTAATASANTLGVSGACTGGTDSGSYSFPLTTTNNGAVVYVAAAMRNRTHTPGSGYTERTEVAAGSGGTIASVAVEDRRYATAGTATVNGTFDGLIDWAAAAVEIRPPTGAPTGPSVTSFAPTSGIVGGAVTISGKGFTGATAVTFNGTSATFAVVDDTKITTSVPAGATTGPLTVSAPGGTAVSATDFTVIVTPVPSSFLPTSGAVGSTVTISGTGFTGTTAVGFNGTSATFSVVNDTSISATVPTGATSGSISVTNPAGTGTTVGTFTVTGGGGGGSITFKDVRTGTSVSSSTVSTSTNVTSAVGDLYLAAVAAKSNTTVTGVTGMGLTWTPVVVQCAGRAQTGVAVWKAQGTPSGDGLVDCDVRQYAVERGDRGVALQRGFLRHADGGDGFREHSRRQRRVHGRHRLGLVFVPSDDDEQRRCGVRRGGDAQPNAHAGLGLYRARGGHGEQQRHGRVGRSRRPRCRDRGYGDRQRDLQRCHRLGRRHRRNPADPRDPLGRR